MDSATPQPADAPAAPPPARRRRWLLPVGAVAVVASAWGAYVWLFGEPAPPPEFVSPYRNTRPGVQYVGTARCNDCHKQHLTYRHHPMGRSVSPADRWIPAQFKAARAFEEAGVRYTVERQGERIVHKEAAPASGPVAAEVAAETTYAIGSGHQGQSFVVPRGDRLFESPISWYTRGLAWAPSPGYEHANGHFNRPVSEACLVCHANDGRAEPGTLNRYSPERLRLEPIGCERCHGPGELHVALRERGEPVKGKDWTIVNPRRLEPYLRDAVCQQCHLQGEARIPRRGQTLADFRPGLPLHDFVSVFVRPPGQGDARKAVSHVEQLAMSRCFQGSGGKMGCISCHDPHALPTEEGRVAWYRDRCLKCHEEKSCGLAPAERRRQDAADNCVRCHMPRGDSSNIAHSAVTDHRLLRHPGFAPRQADRAEDAELVSFHKELLGAGRTGAERDLGMALVELMGRAGPEPQRRDYARRACVLLGPAVANDPGDLDAAEALGLALLKDERPREALATLDKVLRQAPKRDRALQRAGLAALAAGEKQRSIECWERLVAVNPHIWQSHGFLAQALAASAQWARAAAAARAALRLHPFEVAMRTLLIRCLLRQGERTQARAELDTLLVLQPERADALRRWFDE